MDHDTRIGQRITFAFRAGRQEQRAHARGLSQTDRIGRRLDVLHRVIDPKPAVTLPPGELT